MDQKKFFPPHHPTDLFHGILCQHVMDQSGYANYDEAENFIHEGEPVQFLEKKPTK